MPGQNDLLPWLQSLMQNQGAPMPGGATLPGSVGGGTYPYPAATPGGPSMGYPAQGQPGPPPPPQPSQAPFPAGPSPMSATTPASPMMPPPSPTPDNDPTNIYNRASHATAAPMMPPRTATPWPTFTGGGIGGDARFPWGSGNGGIGSDANFPVRGAGGFPTTYAAPGQQPFESTPPGSPSATPRPADSAAKGPLATSGGGGATMKRTPGAPNLGYYQGNNRFVQVDRPNASAAGGFGRGGPPQMTALNLAGMFGGGQQPAALNNVGKRLTGPGDVPAAMTQPVSATAPNAYPGDAGWNVDARGNPIPDTSSADPTQMSPAALAGAVSKPNWWQQFGRPDMSPGQLASAVRKPNWYRNM